MIVGMRVDERLVHGQVAVSWTAALKANCILVANDECASDDAQRAILRMAKPAGRKLVIKGVDESQSQINAGATDKYSLFIIVKTIGDAYRLAMGCDSVTSVNLGNVIPRPGARKISRCVSVTDDDARMLRELVERGIKVEVRALPNDKPVPIEDLL